MEQKWPSTLVLVRHGESVRNVQRKLHKESGALEHYHDGLRDIDTSLTARGFSQAEHTGRHLAQNYTFQAAITSPYLRTVQTAEAILRECDAAPGLTAPSLVLDERIREIEFGVLDGLTDLGIRKKYPDEWERKRREGGYFYRPPGGESRPDVALRVHSFLGTLTRDYRGHQVLVVCHSVVVLIFRRLLERWDEAEYLRVNREDDVKNCAITAYRFDAAQGKLVLDQYNSICYAD